MQNVKLTDDFHRQSVENDNPGRDIMARLLPLVIQMVLKDKKSPLKKGSIHMKFSMTEQEKGDLSIQVTAY